ncbi:uncharacterized protein LOC119643314 [Glossina fuscipes]|uniref:Uncharacterized protein LOC119643314 n=1 Tax=Glossina fuscipes TaxID=7396 RepID=A0A9C5ZH86_9MUSC|nr:uncharacterized protein LOC119643314 [Glossina fuscipes]
MTPSNGLIIIIILTLGFEAQASLYRFVPEYPELSIDCTNKPGTVGMDHFVDQSELIVSHDDEGIHYSGTLKMIWDIKKGDRVTMDAELQKFFRGGWIQTPFSVRVLDFCKEMEMTDSYIYELWSRHVFPEDLQCFGKGIKYRHNPFTAKADGQALVNMEGRYKVVAFFRAYDEHIRLRPEVICLEVPGDIIKI